MVVSVRELKSRLSHWILMSREGHEVVVTSHQRVVARLVGVPERVGPVQSLVESGAVTWSGGKPAGASLSLRPGGRLVSELVSEDRG